jgi:hypothetical protein
MLTSKTQASGPTIILLAMDMSWGQCSGDDSRTVRNSWRSQRPALDVIGGIALRYPELSRNPESAADEGPTVVNRAS